MLHAQFQDHRTSGPGEEDFLRLLPYISMAGEMIFTKFMFPLPKKAPH